MTPELFRQQLAQILAFASQQGNRIEMEQVRTFFAGQALSEEQIRLVCEFLLSQKVIVSGAAGAPEEASDAHNTREQVLRPEERRWLTLYREELAAIRPADPSEWQTILLQLRQNAAEASARLTELLLPEVLALAMQMERGQTMLQDLVQEGNLQLLLSAGETDWRMTASAEEARERLLLAASGAMQALSAEQADVRTKDRKMVEKAENLKDGIAVLKEEMGRKVYLDEVADFLSMTEEEAEDILRLTGEEPSGEEP